MGNENEQLNVNHDFEFHAEIKYETENGFGYVCAMGDTVKELKVDIKDRFSKYETREPEVVEVIYRPNDVNKKVTDVIKKELEAELA